MPGFGKKKPSMLRTDCGLNVSLTQCDRSKKHALKHLYVLRVYVLVVTYGRQLSKTSKWIWLSFRSCARSCEVLVHVQWWVVLSQASACRPLNDFP